MLIGQFHHNLQAKGRIAIPAKFRDELGEKVILTQGVDACLNLLPFNIWSRLIANLGDNPLVSKEARQLRRLLAHQAVEVEYDAQGRILIPEYLRDWAKLKKAVVIAGSIDWVELWDLDTYKSHINEIGANAEVLAETLQKQP